MFLLKLNITETFSQICLFNFTTRVIEVPMVPWIVIDQPRFSFRGLLIGEMPSFTPEQYIYIYY